MIVNRIGYNYTPSFGQGYINEDHKTMQVMKGGKKYCFKNGRSEFPVEAFNKMAKELSETSKQHDVDIILSLRENEDGDTFQLSGQLIDPNFHDYYIGTVYQDSNEYENDNRQIPFHFFTYRATQKMRQYKRLI